MGRKTVGRPLATPAARKTETEDIAVPTLFESLPIRPGAAAVPATADAFRSPVLAGILSLTVPDAVPAAEKLLGTPVPALPASLYRDFARTGNRARYEAPYFARRDAALTLMMAERTEKKGRFTDLLVDYVWAICEESTWVIPAHNAPCHKNPLNCLPDSFDLGADDDMRHIDLFSAATGAMLAWIHALGEEILDAVTPVIRRRVLSLLEKRIFHPYLDVNGENNWWMGEHGERLNNWTPWIVSNVLTAVMLCEKDDGRRALALDRSALFLDRFTRDYPADGGCDEGPGYWGVAGASVFDCLEIIRDMTGGAVDLIAHPFVRRMCEYIADFRLTKDAWANFADASHLASPSAPTVARMGRLTGSDKLLRLAADLASPASYHRWVPGNTTYRAMENLFEPLPQADAERDGGSASGSTSGSTSGSRADGSVFYPDLGILIVKNEKTRMALAAKGGHNAESHNHNDAGSFILWSDEKPVFVDAGVEQYTKTTFSPARYTLWTMRSTYHNLPAFRKDDGDWTAQREGGRYAARILSREGGFLTMELKDTYPEDAGLVSFVRRVGLDDKGFLCEDRFVFSEPAEVRFTLMCPEGWTGENGEFTLGSAGVKIMTDPSLCKQEEPVALGDKLRREWGRDTLIRVLLTAPAAEKGAFVLRAAPDII